MTLSVRPSPLKRHMRRRGSTGAHAEGFSMEVLAAEAAIGNRSAKRVGGGREVTTNRSQNRRLRSSIREG